MTKSFQVFPYSIDKLISLLAEKSIASPRAVSNKFHSVYFKEYFQKLQTKTVVVENDYVDRDFLEDFAGYYVRCFKNYKRYCTRLHFFNSSFGDTDLQNLLKGNPTSQLNEEILQNAYLGFVVVRPLPQTIIGRTCLKTYTDEGRRHFPAIRNYETNLFGFKLNIETLAFQEQDKVVAACATSALWSAFQGTSVLFQHYIPSPVEITKIATTHPISEKRSFPNIDGLSAEQMAQAIRSLHLETCFEGVLDPYVLKSNLYAYLRNRIPVIMILNLFDISKGTDNRDLLGRHTVTITGYSLGHKNAIPYSPKKDGRGNLTKGEKTKDGFLLVASKIDKIYVHDDQVGPFARMEFDNFKMGQTNNSLSTSRIGESKRPNSVRAIPDIMLIPVYHKIRIPFNVIFEAVASFDSVLEILRKENKFCFSKRLNWDIFLTENRNLKSSVKLSALKGDYRAKILLQGMPRFMWRASAYLDNKLKLDLLFDATDIEQGIFFVRAIEYDDTLSLFLKLMIPSEENLTKLFEDGLGQQIFEWFKSKKT